jgi:hypothetical protein
MWFDCEMDAVGFLTDRLALERASGEVALCDSAVNACEGLIKHTSAVLVASIPHDGSREERYGLEHQLLRTSGVGDWGRAVQTIAVGNLNRVVQPQLEEIDTSLAELSQRVKAGTGAMT